jgi:hypothetical protein
MPADATDWNCVRAAKRNRWPSSISTKQKEPTMNVNDLARWIVEHGADKPEVPAEVGVPLYLPVPEYPVNPNQKEPNYDYFPKNY